MDGAGAEGVAAMTAGGGGDVLGTDGVGMDVAFAVSFGLLPLVAAGGEVAVAAAAVGVVGAAGGSGSGFNRINRHSFASFTHNRISSVPVACNKNKSNVLRQAGNNTRINRTGHAPGCRKRFGRFQRLWFGSSSSPESRLS